MFEIDALTSERLLEHDGIPVIKLTIATPVVSGGNPCAMKRINAFYVHLAVAVEKHLSRRMLLHATMDFNAAVSKSRPFEPYRVKLTFDTSHSDDGNTLTVTRRLYLRTRNSVERDYILTESWNTRLGLPENLTSKTVNYSSSSDITDISYAVRSSAPSSVAFM